MMSDLTCEEFEDLAPELALGVLAGGDRAAALAHLAGCPQCREHLDGLVRVGDTLLLLAPHAEPPIGFESRVMAGLAVQGAGASVTPVESATSEGRGVPPDHGAPAAAEPASPPGAPAAPFPPLTALPTPGFNDSTTSSRPQALGPSRARQLARRWLAVGVAAALIAVAAVSGLMLGHGRSAKQPLAAVRTAVVTADDGKSTCRVVAFPGVSNAPTVLAIHLDESGVTTASYPVLVEPATGRSGVRIGDIKVQGGEGDLVATVPAGTGKIKGILVVWPDGSLHYQATFAPV